MSQVVGESFSALAYGREADFSGIGIASVQRQMAVSRAGDLGAKVGGMA
jgi:hypothetical protein